MSFLLWLEELRNPVLDAFFSFVTIFGEEVVFIFIGVVFYWCVSKNKGYYLLCIGLIGTIINQFLKLIFRIPRPWVKDENFTIVEAAREQATGYSFPSGHTQNSVGIWGGIACCNKSKILKGISTALCILVPFSRLYLGVHTPLDVGVSIIIALALIFSLYPIIQNAVNEVKTMRILFAGMMGLATAYLAFVSFFSFPADIDLNNLAHGAENAYKMFGCIGGLWLSFEADRRYLNFETKGVFWVQILKLVFGIAIILGIKEGLKSPLVSIIGNQNIADLVRYLLIALFAGIIWPLTFRFWNKLFKNK